MNIFENKIVIVTGGASGIGRALGKQLAARKAQLILADINTKLLEETANGIAKAGGRVKPVRLDVTDFMAVKKLVDDTATEYGRLDYIFNNAGIAVFGEARDFSYEDWRKVIDTDLYGVVNGVAAAYPVMVKQGFGHIVNTASGAGLVPMPAEVSYATSKFGVVGLSNALRMEGEALGVRVSVACPGFVATPIFETTKHLKLDRDKVMKILPKGISADECARAILSGVERNQATIVVTTLAKVLWWIHRISPAITFWMWRRNIRKMREARIED